MTTTLLRAGALACALMASTALTAPALAQTGQTTPPETRSVDANGVDLISGDYVLSLTEAVIGSGEGALALVRTGTPSAMTSNWQNVWLELVGDRVTVVLGDRSELFDRTGSGPFNPVSGNGATLTGAIGSNFVYTSADGTVITFGTPAGNPGGESDFCKHPNADPNGCRALAMSLVRPSGGRLSFGWDIRSQCTPIEPPVEDCDYVWRLGSISNNFGYAIDFDFASDSYSFPGGTPDFFLRTSATLSNLNVSGETPLTVAYGHPSPGVTEVTVPGPTIEGLTWRFASGSGTFGIRRPGSSSDDVSIAFGASGVASVTLDGVVTDYARVLSSVFEAPLIETHLATTTVTQVDGDPNTADSETVVVANLDLGVIRSVTDPLDNETVYQHDGEGRLTRLTLPEGNGVGYTYDARGNVTETRAIAKPDSGFADIVTEADFPSACANPVTCNRPTATRDALDHQTDYSWDSTHGGLLTATAPAPTSGAGRPQTRYTYSQVTAVTGQPVTQLTGISACSSGSAASCVGTANETRTIIAYDSVNIRPASVETRAGDNSLSATTAFGYSPYGDVTSVDGPLPGTDDTTHIRHDAARRPLGAISPDPDGPSTGSGQAAGYLKRRATRIAYRPDGQASALETGTVEGLSDADWAAMSVIEAVQADYDSDNRPVVLRLVSGSTTHALTQTGYDALGRVRCVAQRMNPAEFATASLPADACALDTEGSFGPDRITLTTYDAAGREFVAVTALGAAGEHWSYVLRSANGHVQYLADINGGTTNISAFQYDGHDRLWLNYYPKADGSDVNWADSEANAYDANGNVTARRMRDGQMIVYAYDALDRLVETDRPGSELTVTYSYDLLGRLAGASQTGNALTFTYDALGRNLSQSGLHGSVGYGYDLAGRRTTMTYADSGLAIGYSHLVTGEVSEIRENPAGANALLGSYAYDDLGRRTLLTRGNGTTTSYAYDTVSRLTELVQNLNGTPGDLTLGFEHNPAGQIVSNTRSNDAFSFTGHANVSVADTINGLNQVTQTGSTALSYGDARGNITGIGSSSYGYSSENMLVTAPGSTTLSYDPMLRLNETAGGATTRFGYDGVNMIAEYNGSNALHRRYVFGPGIDEPLVWYEGTGTSTPRYFHADERGSIVAVSDSSGDLYANRNRYDEYGVPQGGALTGRFGFTGQAWLPAIEVYYYRARMYDPALGRFLQPDPIGYAGGMNLYAYVLNDPVNLIDVTGLDPQDCPIAQCGEPPLVCGRPSRHPSNECYDGGYASMFARMFGEGFMLLERPNPPFNPVEDLVTALRDRARNLICRALSALPEDGRLRVGADAGYGLGPAGVGGIGMAMHRDGSINRDRYFGYGGGVGYSAAAGASFDMNARAPGWTSTRMDASVSAGGRSGGMTLTYNRNEGFGLVPGIGIGTPAGIWTVTRTHVHTERLSDPMCPAS